MRETKRSRHQKTACSHNTKTATETAGIRRTVCDSCGHMSFDYLYDVFAAENEQLSFAVDEVSPR